MSHRGPTALFALIIGFGVVASSAQACRVNQPPEARMSQTYDAVVIGTVVSAQQRDADAPGESRAWEAVVEVASTIEGTADASSYQIGRTGDSAACDDGQPIARVGETWVLYLRRHASNGMVAGYSYPYQQARELDRRLSNRPAL